MMVNNHKDTKHSPEDLVKAISNSVRKSHNSVY